MDELTLIDSRGLTVTYQRTQTGTKRGRAVYSYTKNGKALKHGYGQRIWREGKKLTARAGAPVSVREARGHRFDRESVAQMRRNFRSQYHDYFVTQAQIDGDGSLSMGQDVKQVGKKVKTVQKSWAVPWWKQPLQFTTKYDWYAKVRVLVDTEELTVGYRYATGSDQGGLQYDPTYSWTAVEATIILHPESDYNVLGGFVMDDVVRGFEQNLLSIVSDKTVIICDEDGIPIGFHEVQGEEGEKGWEITPPTADDIRRFLTGLFRHRFTPAEREARRKRTIKK